jgi:hypothetical protein
MQALARYFVAEYPGAFSTWEHGIGKAGGSEILGHGVRAFLEHNVSGIVGQSDLRNAFGEISRQRILDLAHRYPALAHAIRFLYGQASTVDFGSPDNDFVITSEEGCRQGCPLGGLVFSLGMRPELDRVRAAFPAVTYANYYDDVSALSTHPTAMQEGFAMLTSLCADINLRMQPAKCKLYAPSLDVKQLAAAMEIPHTADGIIVCGVPVGSAQFVRNHVRSVADDCIRIARAIGAAQRASEQGSGSERMDSLQGLFTALRLCVATKYNHLMRTVQPEATTPEAERIDAAVYQVALELIMCTPDFAGIDVMHEGGLVWARARALLHLPTRKGGVGLASLAATAPAAFVGSVALTGKSALRVAAWKAPLTQMRLGPHVPSAAAAPQLEPPPAKPLPRAFDVFPGLVELYSPPPPNIKLPAPDSLVSDSTPRVQRQLADAIHEQAALEFEHSLAGDTLALAHYAGLRGTYSGAWVDALRGRDRRFRLRDDEFRAAARIRLGLPVAAIPDQPRCKCDAAARASQYHFFTCADEAGRNGRSRRHTNFKYALVNSLRSLPAQPLGITVEKRVRDLFHPRQQLVSGQDLVADVVVELPPTPPARKPIHVLLDTSVTVNFATSLLAKQNNATPAPGSAMLHGETAKLSKYNALFTIPPGSLVPFCADMFGGLGKLAIEFLDRVFPITTTASADQKKKAKAAKRMAVQLMAVGIARGNYRCVLQHTNPSDPRVTTRETPTTATTKRKPRTKAPGVASKAGNRARN